MRTLHLPDASTWELETVPEERPAPDDRRDPGRRDSRRRTYVWVRCAGPDREFRLMFAATWELWSDATLVRAIDAERDRLAASPREVTRGDLAPTADAPRRAGTTNAPGGSAPSAFA